MSRVPHIVWILAVLLLVSADKRTVSAAEIALATDAAQPLAPEESRRLFRVPAGFHVELVASEPHLADPVAMAFDARGRILVCEIHGYNLEGYFDILELNKTGVLDKAVRRIMANPEAMRRAEAEQYGTVKVLEDTDGDGRVDRSSVLADRLPPCYGLVPAREGAIVLCAPDIMYLADRDGDGHAEIQQKLFTGFGVGEMWTRINNPRWLPDNWIYGVSGGGSGGKIQGPNLAREVDLASVCFRLKADGSSLEPASGRTSGFGQAINDWGDRFLCTNQQHALYVAPLPYRYLARNPNHAVPNLTVNISSYGHPAQVFPTSKPDPWRLARSQDPAWVNFYGAAEATANGYFTAASGQAIYQGVTFPPEFHGNHFSVDNAQNLIHRCLLLEDGNSFTVRRPRENERQEFLTSTEQWFRPVQLLTGPDGALYVVDMYRDIIEDYSAIPRFLQQLYVKSLIAGSDRGRIWRIVADDASQRQRVDLAGVSTRALVDELSNPNFWWRMTAQRLLVERGDRSQVAALEALVRRREMSQTRMHAMYALDGLDALRPAIVQRALDDPHFAVRMHALRLAERWLEGQPEMTASVVARSDDPHRRVRLQLALTLGQSRNQHATAALSQLAIRHGDERWMTTSILSSIPDSADRLLEAIIRQGSAAGKAASLVAPLASSVGARHEDEEIGRLLVLVGDPKLTTDEAFRVSCLKGLIEGLERGRPQALHSPAGIRGLCNLLLNGSAEEQQLALYVASLVKLRESPEVRAAQAKAREVALDDQQPIEARVAALTLLRGAAYDELESACTPLLDARQPIDVQLAAIRTLSSTDDARGGPAMLYGFTSYTPKLRAAVIDAIFSRQNRLTALLDALDEGTVPASSLDAIRRRQLLANSSSAVAGRAKQLLGDGGSGRTPDEVLTRYRAALSLERDVEHGKAVFEKQCSKCHKLAGVGYEVGPDLTTVRTRPDETLVSDVMDPSNQITVGYNNYTVVTEAGRIYSGVLAAETATSIALRKEEGAEQTILRRDIDEMEAAALSLMPEDLHKEVTPRDLADLIGYLRKTLGAVAPAAVTLVDDDPQMVELLNQGSGSVRLETKDCFVGTSSLAVMPPQRFSPRIPGWEYRITENPGPGEFCSL